MPVSSFLYQGIILPPLHPFLQSISNYTELKKKQQKGKSSETGKKGIVVFNSTNQLKKELSESHSPSLFPDTFLRIAFAKIAFGEPFFPLTVIHLMDCKST